MPLNAKKKGRDKMIKTFRGLLASGGQDQIRLSTIKGTVGYQIVKFELLPNAPGTVSQESIAKVYSDEQTTVDAVIDFSDNTLLAAVFYSDGADNYPGATVIILDNMVFNQDIYITHSDVAGGASPCNYYIELEVIPLTDQGAEYTTIKDLRSKA